LNTEEKEESVEFYSEYGLRNSFLGRLLINVWLNLSTRLFSFSLTHSPLTSRRLILLAASKLRLNLLTMICFGMGKT
jgi:hypothetical protein